MNQVATKTDFYFRPRYRKSPFFEATRRAGCKAYGIYNHMYIPDYYSDAHEEYRSLTNDVTLWDVSVERIVEITGADASEFTNRLTPRDLTKCAVGQGKYVLITAEDGGIINEPVVLRLGENQWWLALSDSDAGLRSATRSTFATRAEARSCGTASWKPARRTTSGRSRPRKSAASRPASSATAPT